jgi:hypothetical protein
MTGPGTVPILLAGLNGGRTPIAARCIATKHGYYNITHREAQALLKEYAVVLYEL